MKIVFDAFWWGGGPPSLRHVMREIIIAWHKKFPEDELILVTRKKHTAANSSDQLPGVLLKTVLWPQALAATQGVRRIARHHNADAVLTHNFAASVPNAVSSVYLHDVLFTTNPEWFTRIERLYFSFMCRWIRRADVVFTSSHCEAARIRDHSDAHFVVPVGLGLSTELTAAEMADDPDPTLTPGQFLLTVGRLNVRKNLETTILSALRTGLVDRGRPLVVVGNPGGKSTAMGSEVREAIQSGAVVFTGFVPEARLRWLYRNTALFSFLSLGEGFGMPPVEAAYFGAPVLVSDLDVFQETLGTAARYVQPTDTSAISALMTASIAAGQVSTKAVNDRDELGRRHNWDDAVGAMRSVIVDLADEHDDEAPR